jgi:VanZ family protein
VSDPGAQRALRQAWLVVGWIGVAALVALSLVPQPPTFPEIEQGDKLQHLVGYGALMLWFAQVHVARAPRAGTALALLALGVAIEFAQGLTGTRTFSIADMGADAAGIALGWLAAPPRGPNLFVNLGRMVADLR